MRPGIRAFSIAALVVALAACASLCPETWFVAPRGKYFNSYWRKHYQVVNRESMLGFWTFDEPAGPCRFPGVGNLDAADIPDAIHAGVSLARGRHGMGAKFNGDNDAFWATGLSWKEFPDEFSIAFWAKLKQLPASQDILCTWLPKIYGFWLDRGLLRFDYTLEEDIGFVSYKFDKFGEWVHLAVVADRKKGYVRLYQDGVLMSEDTNARIVSAPWQFIIGKGSLSRSRFPLNGTIDDLGIWNRALSESELNALVKTPFGLQDHFNSLRVRLTLKCKLLFAGMMEKIGRLMPARLVKFDWRVKSTRPIKDIEPVDVYLRDADWRKLTRIHAKSRRSGCLASDDYVTAYVTMAGKTMECKASLAGGTTCYPYVDRPGYRLEPLNASDELPCGTREIEILPPESSGWMVPFAISEMRKAAGFGMHMRKDCNLVRLNVNGVKRGVYLMRDASRMCVCLDEDDGVLKYNSGWQPKSQRDAEKRYAAPPLIDEATLKMAAVLSQGALDNVKRRLGAVAKTLAADGCSPVPRSLRTSLAEGSLVDCLNAMDMVPSCNVDAFPVNEAMFLGRNLLPWCIASDLDFSQFEGSLPKGWIAEFASSNEGLVSSTGKVTRPAAKPELVAVSVTVRDEFNHSRTTRLEFRVLPRENPVPVVLLNTQVPLGRTHRTQARIEIYEFDADGAPICKCADGSWIRYRGNSSFRSERRLVSIKTDSPHHWFGDTETRHILGINAYTDELRVWSTLAFDLFRSFPRSDGGTNLAPHVKVAELFVNGRYRSLMEFSERIDEKFLGRDDCVLFRHQVARPRVPYMRQATPDLSELDGLGHYLDFERILSESDKGEASIRRIKSMLDMTSVIDYMILFSLLVNRNGDAHSMWTQEFLAYDTASGRYFYIPWDFDSAMSDVDMGLIQTDLNRLLADADPEYNKAVAKRWRELRLTVLSTDSVLSKFDEIVSRHVAYIPFEIQKWTPDSIGEFDLAAYSKLKRGELEARLEILDAVLSDAEGGHRQGRRRRDSSCARGH